MTERAKAASGRWARLAGTAVVAVALFFLVRGCAFMPWNRGGREVEARVTVTRDFGTHILKDQGVRLEEGGSAMEALRKVAQVETAYGGGFIQGIDGLRSLYGDGTGEEVDWFFYVNGHMADVGADAYIVREGDWLVFDYHPWGYSMFTPFLAGCLPRALRAGYGGEAPERAVVVHTPGAAEQAEEVADVLGGVVPACETLLLEEGWAPRAGEYAVVVGVWKEMEGNAYLQAIRSGASRLGLYAYFEGGGLELVGPGGEAAGRLAAGAGLLEATGPRLGDGRSAFLVCGLDGEGLQEAVEALRELVEEGGRPVLALVALAGDERMAVPGEVR